MAEQRENQQTFEQDLQERFPYNVGGPRLPRLVQSHNTCRVFHRLEQDCIGGFARRQQKGNQQLEIKRLFVNLGD